MEIASRAVLVGLVRRATYKGVDLPSRLGALDGSAALPSALREALAAGEPAFDVDAAEEDVLVQDHWFAADPPLFSSGKRAGSHVGKVSVGKLRDFLSMELRAVVQESLDGLVARAAGSGARIVAQCGELLRTCKTVPRDAIRAQLRDALAAPGFAPTDKELGSIAAAKQFAAPDGTGVDIEKLQRYIEGRTDSHIDQVLKSMVMRALKCGVMLVTMLDDASAGGAAACVPAEELATALEKGEFQPSMEEMGCLEASSTFSSVVPAGAAGGDGGGPVVLIKVGALKLAVADEFKHAVDGRVQNLVHRALRCKFDLAETLRRARSLVDTDADGKTAGMDAAQLQDALLGQVPFPLSAEDLGCVVASDRFAVATGAGGQADSAMVRRIDVALLEHFVAHETMRVEFFEWFVRNSLLELTVRGNRTQLDFDALQPILCPGRGAHELLSMRGMCDAFRRAVHELQRRTQEQQRRHSGKAHAASARAHERTAMIGKRLNLLLAREAPAEPNQLQRQRLGTVLMRMGACEPTEVGKFDELSPEPSISVAQLMQFARTPRFAPNCVEGRMRLLMRPLASTNANHMELAAELKTHDVANVGGIDARSLASVLRAHGLALHDDEQRELTHLLLRSFSVTGMQQQLLHYRDFVTFLWPPVFVLQIFTPFTKFDLRVSEGESVSDIRLRIQKRLFWQQHSAEGAAGFNKGDAQQSIGSDFLIFRHCGVLPAQYEMYDMACTAFRSGEMLFVVDANARSAGFVFHGERGGRHSEHLEQQGTLAGAAQAPPAVTVTKRIVQARRIPASSLPMQRNPSAQTYSERAEASQPPRAQAQARPQIPVEPARVRTFDAAYTKTAVESWSVDDVRQWLCNELEMLAQADVFASEEVDGRALLELSDEALQRMGLESRLRRKKVLLRVAVLRHGAKQRELGRCPNDLSQWKAKHVAVWLELEARAQDLLPCFAEIDGVLLAQLDDAQLQEIDHDHGLMRDTARRQALLQRIRRLVESCTSAPAPPARGELEDPHEPERPEISDFTASKPNASQLSEEAREPSGQQPLGTGLGGVAAGDLGGVAAGDLDSASAPSGVPPAAKKEPRPRRQRARAMAKELEAEAASHDARAKPTAQVSFCFQCGSPPLRCPGCLLCSLTTVLLPDTAPLAQIKQATAKSGDASRKAGKAGGARASARELSIKQRQQEERHDANAADLQEYLTILTENRSALQTFQEQLHEMQDTGKINRTQLEAAVDASESALRGERDGKLEQRVARLCKRFAEDPSTCSDGVSMMLDFVHQMEADVRSASKSIEELVAALRLRQ
jgi:hypothetical protein